MTVGELATVLRSKNAGIGYITVDVICGDQRSYEAVKHVLTPRRVAAAYGLPTDRELEVIDFAAGLAVKLTFPRPGLAGGAGLGETDLYGSAQYAPLLDIEVDRALDTVPSDLVS